MKPFATVRLITAVLLILSCSYANAGGRPSEEEVKEFLKTYDVVDLENLIAFDDQMVDEYVFDKAEDCRKKKMEPMQSQTTEGETVLCKAVRYNAECYLKFYKENTKFQKAASAKASKRADKLLEAIADDLTPDQAKAIVSELLKLLPRSKYKYISREILMRSLTVFRDRKDQDSIGKLERKDGIHTVEAALESLDPIVIYRVTKQAFMSNEIWYRELGTVRL